MKSRKKLLATLLCAGTIGMVSAADAQQKPGNYNFTDQNQSQVGAPLNTQTYKHDSDNPVIHGSNYSYNTIGGGANYISNAAPNLGTTTVKTINAPTVFVPNLPAGGIDTCLGSSSAGLSIVGFGASGASTWTDQNCVMIKQATLLSNLGLKDAAVARLMQDENLRDALLVAYPAFARFAPQTVAAPAAE